MGRGWGGDVDSRIYGIGIYVLLVYAAFLRIWFSVSVKNTGVFMNLLSDVVFVFSYLGSGFPSI